MTVAGLHQGAVRYVNEIRCLSRNCRLGFVATVLSGMSQGIFAVVFNLYVLSLGIGADVLGGILSAGPLAQALGSIPAGFLAEMTGFRKAFLVIYGIAGLAKLVQASSASVPVIAAAAFVGGLVFSGDFVVRLPFVAANTSESQRTRAYSVGSLLFGLSMSVGALFAGYAPNLLRLFVPDLTTAYRYTLYVAGVLTLLAALPFLRTLDPVRPTERKISLYPYLWGIDRFTLQQAVVSLFVGLSMGVIAPFRNLYFMYHLGTTREVFSTLAALTILPTTVATAFAPIIARRLGNVRAVTLLRSLIAGALATMAWTTYPWLGALAYWTQRSLSTAAQPLSFAFAMDRASRKAKPAVSAWLNVTFWLGRAVAAPITGSFIAKTNYTLPLYLSAIAILAAAVSNQLFFGPLTARLGRKEQRGD